jgi:hypothetical protein
MWGNPYTHLPLDKTKAKLQCSTREEAIAKYEPYARGNAVIMKSLGLLRGHDLGCFCAPKFCHGSILKKLVQERYGDKDDEQENVDLQGMLFPGEE